MTVLEHLEIWCDESVSESFIDILRSKNIESKLHKIKTKSVVEPTTATTVIEIISTVGSLRFAGVLIAWIKQKKNRTVSITNDISKTTTIITKGYSASDVEKIIKANSEINLNNE